MIVDRHSNVKPVEPEKITGNLTKEEASHQEVEVRKYTFYRGQNLSHESRATGRVGP
jgi:hypothetical protein